MAQVTPEQYERLKAAYAQGIQDPGLRAKAERAISSYEASASLPTQDAGPLPMETVASMEVEPAPASPTDISPHEIPSADLAGRSLGAKTATFAEPESWAGGGSRAHYHHEPSVEEAKAVAVAIGSELPDGAERQEWERKFLELEAQGEGSELYKDYADRKWQAVRSVFEKHGAPVIRQRLADTKLWPPSEAVSPENQIRAIGDVRTTLSPLFLGLDMMGTGGVGHRLAGTDAARPVRELIETSPEIESAYAELQEMGLYPDRAQYFEESGQQSWAAPVLEGIGGIGGLLAGGLGGGSILHKAVVAPGIQASKAAASLRSFPARAAAYAGIGAGEAASTGAVQDLVQTAFEGGVPTRPSELMDSVRDLDVTNARDQLGRAAERGAWGAALGAALPLAGEGVQAFQDWNRRGRYGARIKALEAAGGGVAFRPTGVRPGPEIDRVRREAGEYRQVPGTTVERSISPESLVAEPLAAETAVHGMVKEEMLRARHGRENQDMYKRKTGVIGRPVQTFNKIQEMMKDADFSAFGAKDAVIDAQRKISDLGAHLGPSAIFAAKSARQAANAGRIMDVREALEMFPKKDIAKAIELEIERNPQRFQDVEPGTVHINDIGDVTVVNIQPNGARVRTMMSPSGVRLTATPRVLDAKGTDLTLSELDRRIRWDTNSGAADPRLETLGASIRQDRQRIFGNDYEALKAKHHRELFEHERQAQALVGAKRFNDKDPGIVEKTFNKLLAYGSPGQFGGNEIARLIDDNPSIKRQLRLLKGVQAYEDLSRSLSYQPAHGGVQQMVKEWTGRGPLVLEALSSPITALQPMSATAGAVGSVHIPEVPDFVRREGDTGLRVWQAMMEAAERE